MVKSLEEKIHGMQRYGSYGVSFFSSDDIVELCTQPRLRDLLAEVVATKCESGLHLICQFQGMHTGTAGMQEVLNGTAQVGEIMARVTTINELHVLIDSSGISNALAMLTPIHQVDHITIEFLEEEHFQWVLLLPELRTCFSDRQMLESLLFRWKYTESPRVEAAHFDMITAILPMCSERVSCKIQAEYLSLEAVIALRNILLIESTISLELSSFRFDTVEKLRALCEALHMINGMNVKMECPSFPEDMNGDADEMLADALIGIGASYDTSELQTSDLGTCRKSNR